MPVAWQERFPACYGVELFTDFSRQISEEAKRYLQQHFYVDTEEYDIIIGYRADDSYFSFAQDFMANAIPLRKLSEAMPLGRLGEQIVLKSRSAFASIHFLAAEEAAPAEYFLKKSARDKEARLQYRRNRHTGTEVNDIFMLDIMREGMRHGDPRL